MNTLADGHCAREEGSRLAGAAYSTGARLSAATNTPDCQTARCRLQLGFFRVRRGINSMRIEDGDCWYADPDISMEQDIEDGKYIGSMVSELIN